MFARQCGPQSTPDCCRKATCVRINLDHRQEKKKNIMGAHYSFEPRTSALTQVTGKKMFSYVLKGQFSVFILEISLWINLSRLSIVFLSSLSQSSLFLNRLIVSFVSVSQLSLSLVSQSYIIPFPVLVTMIYHGKQSHIHRMNATDLSRMTMDISGTIPVIF